MKKLTKLTYTLFHTDLKEGANKDCPKLADIRILSTGQILEAWSILYIRPDGKHILMKNNDGIKKKRTRFQILKEQP